MFLNVHLEKKMKEYNSICSLLWQWDCNVFLFLSNFPIINVNY